VVYFFLNYVNNGTTDADNVTLTFSTNSTVNMERIEIGVFNSTLPHYYIDSMVMGEPYPLGTIKVGEEKEFIGTFMGNNFDIHGFVLVATLKSNDTVLDQAVITFR
jgi:hypothetical protein